MYGSGGAGYIYSGFFNVADVFLRLICTPAQLQGKALVANERFARLREHTFSASTEVALWATRVLANQRFGRKSIDLITNLRFAQLREHTFSASAEAALWAARVLASISTCSAKRTYVLRLN